MIGISKYSAGARVTPVAAIAVLFAVAVREPAAVKALI